MDKEDLELTLTDLQNTFAKADEEFIRTFGYIYGTLDTLISVMVENCPEVSIAADKLFKTFKNLEGVYSEGIKSTFKNILALQIEEVEKLPEPKQESDQDPLKTVANILKNQKKGK